MSAFGEEIWLVHEQCSACKYGKGFCPIAAVQLMYDQEAKKDEAINKLLDVLFDESGVCSMFNEHREDFAL